jgi:hypothetical protein
MTAMPKIDISRLSDPFAIELARQIVKPDGTLYASKPKKASGLAKYVWRMVAFGISPIGQHHCMPIMADFDISNSDVGFPMDMEWSHPDRSAAYDRRKLMAKVLDKVADAIVMTVPVREHHGTKRWARAFGYI